MTDNFLENGPDPDDEMPFDDEISDLDLDDFSDDLAGDADSDED